jgi:hypothetical protein
MSSHTQNIKNSLKLNIHTQSNLSWVTNLNREHITDQNTCSMHGIKKMATKLTILIQWNIINQNKENSVSMANKCDQKTYRIFMRFFQDRLEQPNHPAYQYLLHRQIRVNN